MYDINSTTTILINHLTIIYGCNCDILMIKTCKDIWIVVVPGKLESEVYAISHHFPRSLSLIVNTTSKHTILVVEFNMTISFSNAVDNNKQYRMRDVGGGVLDIV